MNAPGAPRTPLEAITRHPIRLFVSLWPVRSVCYLLSAPIVAVLWALMCWPLTVLAGIPLGSIERYRMRLADLVQLPSAHGVPESPGFRGWIHTRLRETATWTELLYGILLLPLATFNLAVIGLFLVIPSIFLSLPVMLMALRLADVEMGPLATAPALSGWSQLWNAVGGLLGLIVGCYATTALAGGEVYLARALLGANREQELNSRVHGLTQSRARITRAFDVERRRIERDLHDGAQQRLTSVIMTLGLLRYRLGDGESASALLNKAHEEVRNALQELRDLVHGIYPAVLGERGLEAALREVAESSAMHISLSARLPNRYMPEVEAGVYFAVCEALTNAAKHSGGTWVEVNAIEDADRLRVSVTDNGGGGADPELGTGLVGIIDRIEALGGTVNIASPVGGPTTITMELACG